MNIFTKMKQGLLVMAALLCVGNTFAADPDLTEYTLVKSFTTGGSVGFAVGSEALSVKAYSVYPAGLQTIYPATAPDEIVGWMAFQGVMGDKGWWNRDSKGMYCYNANRSAAIYGESLTLGSIVVFTSSDAANSITLTNGAGEPDGTFVYQLSEDGKKYYCTITAESDAYVGFCGVKNGSYISKIEIYQPNNPIVVASYQIKFVNGAGEEVKDAVTVEGIAGDAITLADIYKKSIITAEAGYIYTSDDAEGKTVAADGSTVITVTFREAETWSYTVNAVDGEGNVLKVLGAGSNFEGETISVPYNQYIFHDGVLYEAAANGNEYNKKYTLSEDGMEETLTYSVSSKTNTVYFSEAENVPGLTTTTKSPANVRCSNSTGAYNASETPVEVLTLTPGTYTISAQFVGNSGVDFTINCGTESLVLSTTGSRGSGSKEFTITENTKVTVLKAGDSSKCLDWILIQSAEANSLLAVVDGKDFDAATGTYAAATYTRTVNPDYNYGTICLPFAPDAETCENYTFYELGQSTANTVTFVEVETPQANVPYLYSAVDGEATIHTFTGGETTVSLALTPASAGTWAISGSFTEEVQYSIAGIEFYAYKPTAESDVLVKAKNSVTVKPYRAYFMMMADNGGIAPLTTVRIVVRGAGDNGDGTTGIEEVITPDQIEGAAPAIYNLMGQPVAQPVKGQIYIVNGKKVVY